MFQKLRRENDPELGEVQTEVFNSYSSAKSCTQTFCDSNFIQATGYPAKSSSLLLLTNLKLIYSANFKRFVL